MDLDLPPMITASLGGMALVGIGACAISWWGNRRLRQEQQEHGRQEAVATNWAESMARQLRQKETMEASAKVADIFDKQDMNVNHATAARQAMEARAAKPKQPRSPDGRYASKAETRRRIAMAGKSHRIRQRRDEDSTDNDQSWDDKSTDTELAGALLTHVALSADYSEPRQSNNDCPPSDYSSLSSSYDSGDSGGSSDSGCGD